MSFKMKGFPTPFFQKEASYEHTEEEMAKQKPYWYKKDGKRITQHIYCELQKEIPPDVPPSFSLTTNDPDPCGIKAKHKADRAKLKDN